MKREKKEKGIPQKEWEARLKLQQPILELKADTSSWLPMALGLFLALGGVAAIFAEDILGDFGEFIGRAMELAVPILGGLGGLFTLLFPQHRAVFTAHGIFLQQKGPGKLKGLWKIIPYSETLRLELIRRPGRGAYGRSFGRVRRARLHHRGEVYSLAPTTRLDAKHTEHVVAVLSRLLPVHLRSE